MHRPPGWHADLGEFVLPYAAVRTARDPDAELLEFLQSSYRAIASLADWDCKALDIPMGSKGAPYDVEAHRRS